MGQSTSTDLFVELLKISLGVQNSLSRIPSESEWKALYEIAIKQSLVGICFDGIHRLGADSDEGYARIGMSEDLYFAWLGMTIMIQQRNETINERCRLLCDIFIKGGRTFCIMKGQQVGRFYDMPLLRQSGDVDVFVKGGRKSVIDFVQSIVATNQISHQHVQLHVFDDTEVEVHFIAAETHRPLKNVRLQKWFDSQSFVCNNDEYLKGIMVPSCPFNIVHSIVHSFNHMLGEGIGLRQVMDLYYLLKGSDEQSLTEVSSLLGQLGLTRFARGLMAVLKELFMINDSLLIVPPDYSYGKFLIDEIFRAGNLGQYQVGAKTKKGETDFERFIRVTRLNFRLFKYHPLDVLCEPFWRIYNYSWMRFHHYTY